MLEQWRLSLFVLSLILVSGACDAIGFTYAAKIWHDSHLQWKALVYSAVGFASGITLYWITIRYFGELGVVSPELQTLIWFGTTLIGVALLSGRFLHWRSFDQGIAILVLVGIAWLLVRVEN